MKFILKKYEEKCNKQSDINEHLPILKKYAEGCDFVVEMGVRWVVSTWALLAGNPKKMISYDTKPPSAYGVSIEEVYSAAKEANIDFEFILQDDLTVTLSNVDLLFIDTFHDYGQLIQELNLHHNGVNKYIALHDTTLFGEKSQIPGNRGLWYAVEEFLSNHPEWKVHERYTNNNGLTILKKTQ